MIQPSQAVCTIVIILTKQPGLVESADLFQISKSDSTKPGSLVNSYIVCFLYRHLNLKRVI